MKESYLDHNVMALDKTGETAIETPEMEILVGVGFQSYKFPGKYDTNLDPQFAGVLHVRKTTECTLQVSESTVQYSFLIDDAVNGATMVELNNVIRNALKTIFAEDETLLVYQSEYRLTIPEAPKTGRDAYDGKSIFVPCFLWSDWAGSSPFLVLQVLVQKTGMTVQQIVFVPR